jgi:hypothetical protein
LRQSKAGQKPFFRNLLGQERPEWFQNSLNQISELMERWNKRLTLENLSLSQRYIEGKLRIVICFKSKLIERNIQE